MPRLVHSAHRGHCVSGVLSSGSRIYLGGDDVMVAVALRGMSPRSMGLVLDSPQGSDYCE